MINQKLIIKFIILILIRFLTIGFPARATNLETSIALSLRKRYLLISCKAKRRTTEGGQAGHNAPSPYTAEHLRRTIVVFISPFIKAE